MPLPKDFMEEFSPLTGSITILGNPLETLTKKEMSAAIAFLLAEAEEKQRVLNTINIVQSSRTFSCGNTRGH